MFAAAADEIAKASDSTVGSALETCVEVAVADCWHEPLINTTIETLNADQKRRTSRVPVFYTISESPWVHRVV